MRRRPATRMSELGAAATECFIRAGYAGTQVADVAKELGVAKGTVYLHVESKAALFDLAVRFAAGDSMRDLGELPLRSPTRSETFDRIRSELAVRATLPKLASALGGSVVPDPKEEARGVVGEIFDRIHDNRLGLKLLDRCAREMPELAELWYGNSREGVRLGLEAWLRARRSFVRADLDASLASRFMIEALAFWAMHRHWDPAPPKVTDEQARNFVVSVLVDAVFRDPAPTPTKTRR